MVGSNVIIFGLYSSNSVHRHYSLAIVNVINYPILLRVLRRIVLDLRNAV